MHTQTFLYSERLIYNVYFINTFNICVDRCIGAQKNTETHIPLFLDSDKNMTSKSTIAVLWKFYFIC